MIHAYDKIYLDKARTALGRMLDYAVHERNYSLTDFFKLFLSSGVAERFEKGDFTLLAGMSGVEIAYEVLEKSGISSVRSKPKYPANRSKEYWVGWALAYYQWDTALSFSEIVRCIPLQKIAALYAPCHEMDIEHFVDRMNELCQAAKQETNLKLLRLQAGLSQRKLAELSGIPVRTIQQYEQRRKNINKAQAEYLLLLSQVLCCTVEDLIEKV